MSRLGSVPVSLQQVCLTFKDAQEQRHSADYDLARRFARPDVLVTVRQVETAIHRFEALPDSGWKQFFLVSLLIWKPMSNR